MIEKRFEYYVKLSSNYSTSTPTKPIKGYSQ